MPFYEYECENCKFYTELLQKVSDAPLKKCPSCGRNTMKKLVSAPVFRLKGGGWYETDFKSEKENKRNLAIDKEPESASSDESKAPKPVATDKPADSKASDSKASNAKPSDSKPSGKATPSRASASSRAGGALKSSAARKPAASKSAAATKSKSKSKAASRGRR